ncbi:calmodulin-beta-like [Saccostrea echinata]|uniref:calmodulin-beta-like n=1 Tax=Saccostrea echinata TaxID=191078 RepID=UPI002A82F1A8|nr:calmodulin-beta-like [Saccostrea echinata]
MELDADKLQEARAVFKDFDRDGNGFIDESELGTALRRLRLNPTLKEIRSMIEEVDRDNNHKIDFNEFLHFVKITYKHPEELRCHLMEAFKVFDKNGDGFITFMELKSAMTEMGECLSEQEFKEMIRTADLNGDGKINYEEYVAVMCMDANGKYPN